MYVSITGLELRSPWMLFRFYRHALPCFRQARTADGNMKVDARRMNGVFHTLTVWDCDSSMLAFIHSGAHARAIRVFDEIATGKTFGFEADRVPEWDEIHALWQSHGTSYAN